MSSQLNTLDHRIMGLLLKVSAVNLAIIARVTKTQKYKALISINKLTELGFVSCRDKCGAKPLYSAISHSSYFPPVHDVSGGVFSWDDAELAALVAECEEKFLTN